MKFGFVKTCMISPKLKVCDVDFNVKAIKEKIDFAFNSGAEIIVFPELSITGATCGDLFLSSTLLDCALNGLKDIANSTKDKTALIFVGLPLKKDGKVFDVVAAISNGQILSFTAKDYFDRELEFDKARTFTPFSCQTKDFELDGQTIPFGSDIILSDIDNKNLSVAVKVGVSDLTKKSLASIIINPSSIPEIIGRREDRINLASAYSKVNSLSYVVCESGEGESTTDNVYGGHKFVVENGKLLRENKPFTNDTIFADIDTEYISNAKSKSSLLQDTIDYNKVELKIVNDKGTLDREFKKTPFVPSKESQDQRLEQILSMQAQGLKKRIEHTFAKKVVLGLSGGLDSTLAIIVAARAIKELNRPSTDVLAITMPCFGTTSRTLDNAIKLAKSLGATLKKVDISKSVIRHLKDIKHQEGVLDVTYENSQARERTQVLMDIANMNNGMVVGTGDLSELALGWATYNGDHMSMYGVNADIPKTLVRGLVEHVARTGKGKLKAVLLDILDTPVSPELLPPDKDDIAQKTEDIVGPYLLHDFYLYHLINRGFSPAKVYHIAKHTFKNEFDEQTILKWLKTFVRRFFNQQFKRSCVPDGVRVGSVALSPRGALAMPSDAVSKLWLDELENL